VDGSANRLSPPSVIDDQERDKPVAPSQLEQIAQFEKGLERVTRIELVTKAWEAAVIPFHHTRAQV
jgi:hypothetical protein